MGPLSNAAASSLDLLTENPSDEATGGGSAHPRNGPAHLPVVQGESRPAVAVHEAIQGWDQ